MGEVQTVLGIMLLLAELAAVARAMLRRHRDPANRLAWVVVIVALPIIGVVAYLMLGELRISQRRRELSRQIARRLARPPDENPAAQALAHSAYAAPFALGRTINDLSPTAGNHAHLAKDENAAIDEIVADIDAAAAHVHVMFYIWLDDTNGLKLTDALLRAAARGVKVRAMADALGSRRFVRSVHWRDLRAAGVAVRVSLPVGNVLWTMIRGRVDLRNHRKIVVIDNGVAWCGSQNAVDPEFQTRRGCGAYVDIMLRWRGPVVRDLQFLFVSDWLAESDENLDALLLEDLPPAAGDTIAQVVGTGPLQEFPVMSAVFCEMIYSARRELIITTPYYVPDECLQFAVLSAARRGVEVTLVLPLRSDSFVVRAASRSHYRELIEAGVTIYEYLPGLLHSKIMVVDGQAGLIGSANLDRRSFELNFESNVLLLDADLCAVLNQRQGEYIARSQRVSPAEIASTSAPRRAWHNLWAMLGPLL